MNDSKRILVVTSNDDFVATLKRALNRYDVELIHCMAYNNAIELVQNEDYDLVLTELFISVDGNSDEENKESFDSYTIEIDILENDIRLTSPFREDLINLRNIARIKAKQQLFPLGARLANETRLMMENVMLFLNVQDQSFDQEDLKIYLDHIALYYNKRGNNVYYSPWGYTDKIINHFVETEIVEITKCEKVY